MACSLFCAQPLFTQIVASHEPDLEEHTWGKNDQNWPIFIDGIELKVVICNFATILSRGD